MKKNLLFLVFAFVFASVYSETEPNDSPAQANILTLSVVDNGNLVSPDDLDWYMFTMPYDGAFTITTVSDGSVCAISYLYDNNQVALGDNYSPPCTDLTRTITVNNAGTGTYYIKTTRFSGGGNYTIQVVATQTAVTNENEPNDTITKAVLINDSITAHLGYRVNGIVDAKDWFKIKLVQDGNLEITTKSDATGCIVTYLYDSIQNELTNNYNVTCSEFNKVMNYPNCAPGTYYLRVYPHSGFAAYKVIPKLYLVPYKNDPEPNDSAQIAKPLSLNDSIEGHLNFYKNGKKDPADWYRISVPDDGNLIFNSNSETPICLSIDIIDDSLKRIASTDYFSCSTYFKETNIPNIGKGNYYIKVYPFYPTINYGGYKIRTHFLPAFYRNDTIPNDSMKIAVSLKANDSIYGHINYYNYQKKDMQDWYKVTITKDGLLSYSSSSDNSVCLISYMFDKNNALLSSTEAPSCSEFFRTKTQVVTPGTYYFRVNPYYANGYGSYIFRTSFLPAPAVNFSFKQTLTTFVFSDSTKNNPAQYKWDFGDGNSSSLVNPVHTYSGPGTYWVQLIAINAAGSDTLLKPVQIFGIQKILSDHVGNTGDATINVHGGGFTTTSTVILKPTSYPDIIPDSIALTNVGVLSCRFNMRGMAEGVYDVQVKTPSKPDLLLASALTIEAGKPAEAWLQVIGRDRILFNRWQTYTIQYGNNGNVDASGVPVWFAISDDAQLSFKDFRIEPPRNAAAKGFNNLQDSIPLFFNTDSVNGIPFKAKVYPLYIPIVPASSTQSVEILIKSATNIRLLAWINKPYFQSPMNPEVSACIRNAQMSYLLSKIPYVDCLYSGMQIFYDPLEGPKLEPEKPKGWGSWVWDMTCSVGAAAWTCGGDLLPIGAAGKVAIGIASVGVESYSNYQAVQDCYKAFDRKGEKENKIRAVSSFDPNEMIGPKGYTANNYIRKQSTIPYSITFENKKTASAPAAEVFISDTLDASKYDWKTFSFGSVGFGDTSIAPVQGLKEFSTDVDLRSTKKIIVRISGTLDTAKGIISWKFTTLDTLTLSLTEDPDAGFLPPNNLSPEGEGFVSFSVGLKSTIKNNDVLKNKASIIFDYNPPILTNEYINTIDEMAPVSKLSARFYNGSSGKISWSANDNESGVQYYSIKVDEGDTSYFWKQYTTDTTGIFNFSTSKNYKFYCIAEDSLGIREIKSLLDYELFGNKLDENISNNNSFSVFPNPASKDITFEMNLISLGDIKVELIKTDGITCKTFFYPKLKTGKHLINENLSDLADGIYIVRMINNNFITEEKLILKK